MNIKSFFQLNNGAKTLKVVVGRYVLKQKIQEEIAFFNSRLAGMEKEVFNFSKLQVYSKYFNFEDNLNTKILEIGCGLGRFSFWFADRFLKRFPFIKNIVLSLCINIVAVNK
ncbi:MAG: class I SAM-dependent methyltransferase [Endomicrobiia bacterium]